MSKFSREAKYLHDLFYNVEYDQEYRRNLLLNLDDGESMESLITAASRLTNSGKALFIHGLFKLLADEGKQGNRITDIRDTAFAIIKSGVTRGVKFNNGVLAKEYLAAIKKQTSENQAMTGSIATLFEVGTILAPALVTMAQKYNQITNTWLDLSKQFPEDSAERQFIEDQTHELQTYAKSNERKKI